MLTKFHKVLIAALGVQLILLGVVLGHRGDQGTHPPQPLLPGFDAAKVTRVQVSTSAGSDAPLVLAKQGSDWVVASAYDYPAESGKVADLLTSVAKMAAADPIATSAARHEQLHVADDDFTRKLVLTADGKDTTVYTGASAGPRRIDVRIGGDDRVWPVGGLSSGAGLQPVAWIDPTYAKVAPDELVKLDVAAGGHDLALSRQMVTAPAGSGGGEPVSAPGPWSLAADGAPVTEPLDVNAIGRLAKAASEIDVAAPADPKRDTSKPLAVLTLGKASGPPLVLDVLAADQAHVWVHDRSKPTAALVDALALDSVIHATRETLVKKAEPGNGSAGSAAGSGTR